MNKAGNAEMMYRKDEIERRKKELPEKYKKLLKKIDAVDLGNYSLDSDIAFAICDLYCDSALEAFVTIYKLGFMKGMRKAKADMKRKNK